MVAMKAEHLDGLMVVEMVDQKAVEKVDTLVELSVEK